MMLSSNDSALFYDDTKVYIWNLKFNNADDLVSKIQEKLESRFRYSIGLMLQQFSPSQNKPNKKKNRRVSKYHLR